MKRLLVLLVVIALSTPAVAWELFGNGIPDEVSEMIRSKLVQEINTSAYYSYESGNELRNYKDPECYQTQFGQEACVYQTVFEYKVVYHKPSDLRPKFAWFVNPGERLDTIAYANSVVLNDGGQYKLLWHDGFAEFHKVFFKYPDFVAVHEKEVASSGVPEATVKGLVEEYYAKKDL